MVTIGNVEENRCLLLGKVVEGQVEQCRSDTVVPALPLKNLIHCPVNLSGRTMFMGLSMMKPQYNS